MKKTDITKTERRVIEMLVVFIGWLVANWLLGGFVGYIVAHNSAINALLGAVLLFGILGIILAVIVPGHRVRTNGHLSLKGMLFAGGIAISATDVALMIVKDYLCMAGVSNLIALVLSIVLTIVVEVMLVVPYLLQRRDLHPVIRVIIGIII